MWRYALLGRHSNRTPLSYHAYQTIIGDNGLGIATLVPLSSNPDILVLGHVFDLFTELDKIQSAKEKNSLIKIVVLSEEPLWDTVWSGGFDKKVDFRVVNGTKIDFYYFNHLTTSIYDFDSLPYFITTDNNYLARYQMMLSRNKKMSSNQLITLWQTALYPAAFFLERRPEDQFSVEYPQYDLRGLCQYRTNIAEELRSDATLIAGKDWSNDPIRQKLPDWHLDKISRLDGKTKIISALENTHQVNYISEKIFDAYAINGIPLYYASKNHRIFDILPSGAFINLFEKSIDEAVSSIKDYQATKTYAELYIECQESLSKKFAKVSTIDDEREAMCLKINKEILQVL